MGEARVMQGILSCCFCNNYPTALNSPVFGCKVEISVQRTNWIELMLCVDCFSALNMSENMLWNSHGFILILWNTTRWDSCKQ